MNTLQVYGVRFVQFLLATALVVVAAVVAARAFVRLEFKACSLPSAHTICMPMLIVVVAAFFFHEQKKKPVYVLCLARLFACRPCVFLFCCSFGVHCLSLSRCVFSYVVAFSYTHFHKYTPLFRSHGGVLCACDGTVYSLRRIKFEYRVYRTHTHSWHG